MEREKAEREKKIKQVLHVEYIHEIKISTTKVEGLAINPWF